MARPLLVIERQVAAVELVDCRLDGRVDGLLVHGEAHGREELEDVLLLLLAATLPLIELLGCGDADLDPLEQLLALLVGGLTLDPRDQEYADACGEQRDDGVDDGGDVDHVHPFASLSDVVVVVYSPAPAPLMGLPSASRPCRLRLIFSVADLAA